MAVTGPQEPAVGARVLLGGKHKATVRYVGTIKDQPGTWVGIEYDEADRGKHDGIHGGRRYFACVHSPTAGSFVRLAKFSEAVDLGRSLVAAAMERYGLSPALEQAGSGSGGGGPNVDSSIDQGPQQLYVTTAGNRRVAVELVAPDASSRRLSSGGAALAVLAQQRISNVGSAAALQASLPSLTELDLSDNLIASWSFVAELAAALPSLATLNLSSNRLALPSLSLGPEPPAPVANLTGLQILVLNNCGVAWQQAVATAQQLPSLRELHLCGNNLTSLQLPGGAPTSGGDSSAAGEAEAAERSSGIFFGAEVTSKLASFKQPADHNSSDPGSTAHLLATAFGRLKLLDLEDNALCSWADVAMLSTLPSLRSLLLSGNQLSEVQYNGGFTMLRCLMLGANRLSSWEAASQLDRFPALEEARLSDNPITVEAPSFTRYQCIARISRLVALNASAVSAAERWDAEVNYLRQVTDELASAGADEAARATVLASHPRFAALTLKYGELTPAAPKAAVGSALASSMARLAICHGSKILEKKLPVSLTVGKLKLMLERLLRVKAAQQALLLVPPEGSDSQPEDISDEDGRELRYFDVGDGWRLEVGVLDPAARAAALAAAKQAAAAAHAKRMEQHEKAIQQFRAVEQQLMT